jgi:predicted transposase YbfD/YdcC
LPKKTLEACITKGYDVILKVKKNQPNLYKAVVACTQKETLLDEHYMKENNRGRLEKRMLEVYPFPEPLKDVWQNMNVAIKLTRTGIRKGKAYCHENFYISSLCEDAEVFQERIRSYWGIENKVHYVKDVIFGQDGNGLTKENMPANVSIINGFCLSVLRRKHGNCITTTQESLANNVEKLCTLFE